MRKVLLFLVFIVGIYFISRNVEISHRLYISSIYIDYKEEEYETIFFAPSALSVGKSNGESDSSSTLISLKNKSLEKIFNEAESSTDFELIFRQLVSVVFSVNFLKSEKLNEFKEFVLNSDYIDLNFYVFSTDEKGEDLFSFKNPDKVSSYYSILNVSKGSLYLYNYISPIYFVELLRLYSKKSYVIKIPYVSIEESFSLDNEKEKNLKLDGVCVFESSKINIINLETNKFLIYLNDFKNGKFFVEDYPIILNRVEIKYNKKTSLNLEIKLVYKTLITNVLTSEIKEYVIKGIQSAITFFKNEQIDYLFLSDINNKYNKNYTYSDISISLDIKSN